MLQTVTHNAQETQQLGKRLGACLRGGEVIAFTGGMGMGKTAFIRGLACGLGVTQGVSSPTFALVHEHSGRLPLLHYDMYRVESWDDLYSTGFFDNLGTQAVLAIEWSENIEGALPENTLRVCIAPGEGETQRVITLTAPCEEVYRCAF